MKLLLKSAERNGWPKSLISVVVEVVAKLSVPLTERFSKRLVEDALRPAKREIGVEVALVLTPKLLVGVNGNAPEPGAA